MEEELKQKSKKLYNSSDKNYSSKSGGFSENRIAKSVFEIPKETAKGNSAIRQIPERMSPKRHFRIKPKLTGTKRNLRVTTPLFKIKDNNPRAET